MSQPTRDHFAAVDLELISAALGLELTTDLPIIRMREAIIKTATVMKKPERAEIPEVIWGMIDTLFPDTGILTMCPHTPAAVNGSAGFSISVTDLVVTILPSTQAPAAFMAALEQRERYRRWAEIHQPAIVIHASLIRVTSSIFQDLDAAFIKQVFMDF